MDSKCSPFLWGYLPRSVGSHPGDTPSPRELEDLGRFSWSDGWILHGIASGEIDGIDMDDLLVFWIGAKVSERALHVGLRHPLSRWKPRRSVSGFCHPGRTAWESPLQARPGNGSCLLQVPAPLGWLARKPCLTNVCQTICLSFPATSPQ